MSDSEECAKCGGDFGVYGYSFFSSDSGDIILCDSCTTDFAGFAIDYGLLDQWLEE